MDLHYRRGMSIVEVGRHIGLVLCCSWAGWLVDLPKDRLRTPIGIAHCRRAFKTVEVG